MSLESLSRIEQITVAKHAFTKDGQVYVFRVITGYYECGPGQLALFRDSGPNNMSQFVVGIDFDSVEAAWKSLEDQGFIKTS